MGIINLFIVKMFNLVKGAAFATSMMDVDRADVPKDLRWALDCPYDDIDFDKFKHFANLGKHIKSRDQCMGIHGYMWTIQDVNHDFDVDKCEHMYGCIAYFYKEGQSEEQDYKN